MILGVSLLKHFRVMGFPDSYFMSQTCINQSLKCLLLGTDKSEKIVQTRISPLLKSLSDQGLHCLL